MANVPLSFSVEEIMTFQQNRFPMLFIDAVVECVSGEYAKGFKLFSYNEWFFQCAHSESPRVWSSIKIEAMAQVFLMTFLTKDECRGAITMSNRFDSVEFVREIHPGDRLDLEASLQSFRRGVAKGQVKGFVDGDLACSMECTIIVPQIFGDVNRPRLSNPRQTSKIPATFHSAETNKSLNVSEILACLPFQRPWILIDRVVEIEPGKLVRAIKNFTFNEHYFPSHFPGDPNVPGFIQMECCAQAFLLSFLSLSGYKGRDAAVISLSEVRLRRKIVPGECMEINARLDRFSGGIAKGFVEAFVDGEPAISLGLTAVVAN